MAKRGQEGLASSLGLAAGVPAAPTSPPETANIVIEGQLDQKICALEDELDADVLAFTAPILPPLDVDIRDAIEWRVQQSRKRRRLGVLIDTMGGYIEVAQRIVDTLRKHYQVVDFVVPDSALSAGTVLVMSGDAIHMDYFSILGPIDPQVQKGGRLVPALGYLAWYERLVEKSRNGDITTAELHFLVENFDAAELYSYEHARELSITLLEEWLAKYKFKNWKVTERQGTKVTPTMKKQRAREIAEQLNDTEMWHSHSRGISMEVLRKKLRLRIEDFGENEQLSDIIRTYWKLLTDYQTKRGHHYPGVIHVKGKYTYLLG